MKIGKDTLIKLSYTLRYDNAQGEIIEEIKEDEALEAVFGSEVLLSSIEKKLEGLEAGDSFAFSISPEEGYGEYFEENLVRVPMAELLDGVPKEGEKDIFEGNIIPIVDDDGETYEALITAISDDIVSLDFNHPLAGETIYFSGKVISVEPAPKSE